MNKRNLIVITPVKDSIQTIKDTIASVSKPRPDYHYLIYNDFSTKETEDEIVKLSKKFNFELINLSSLTTSPSPNYDIILQDAQKRAISSESDLLIIESDVTVKADTIDRLTDFARKQRNRLGLVGAITVDENGSVNFPYLKFSHEKDPVVYTKRSLSFCCTLITYEFLKAFSFTNLNHEKDWFDVPISHRAIELGFRNVLLREVKVLHKPHSSRPWKQLKYKSPLRYYINKWFLRLDRI